MNEKTKPGKQIDRDKAIWHLYVVSMLIVAVLIAVSLFYCVISDYAGADGGYIRDITIDMVGMFVCGTLIFSVSRDKPWDKQNRSLFRLIFTMCFIFYLDMASSLMEGNPDAVLGVRIVNTAEYFNEALLLYCYWTYIREELKQKSDKQKLMNNICRGLLVINAVLDILNFFFEFYFSVTGEGVFEYGSYAIIAELLLFAAYLIMLVYIIKADRPVRDKLILLTFVIFPLLSNILSAITREYAILNMAYLFSLMLIYINVFAERGKKVAEQQVMLTKQSTALMISQIQPHFLYNTLTTISNLCVTDPEEAEETTILFSQYLRTNLDSLRKTDPVPFRAEVGHIKTYVELEKKRFGEKLNVTYDIREDSFLVPALGIQPIVENSIKHGIRAKDTPGHLKISAFRDGDSYKVVVEDDGVGFVPEAPISEDGRSHVGMINVRTRLKQMCDADMEVVSSPGNGCKTTITFPMA